MVKNYHEDQGPHWCAMNLDLKKAYDSVAQQFLFDFMVVMAFADIFIHWIKQVVKRFKTRESHAPLATSFFYQMFEKTHYKFHPKSKDLQISHLIFGDYCFILRGTDSSSFQLKSDMLQDLHLYSAKKYCFFFLLGEWLKTRELRRAS